MKSNRFAAVSLFVLFLCASALRAPAQLTAVVDFQQAVSEYQQSPSVAAAEHVIALAGLMDPRPAIPAEARKHIARGEAAAEDARTEDDFKDAIGEFQAALNIAPWMADGYRNLAVVQEKARQYESALVSLRLYLLTKPSASDVEWAWDQQTKIEYRQEKAAKETRTKEPAAGASAAAEKPRIAMEGQARMVPDLYLELEYIRPGTFTMGSPADEPGRSSNEGPQTNVTITRPFWLGKTEVTLRQWKAVMGTDIKEQLRRALTDDTVYNINGRLNTLRDFLGVDRDDDPARLLGRIEENLPMHYVSWNDAVEFCHRLTERERAAGRLPEGYEYTLPTEAQWEYACRAGTSEATYAGPIQILGERNAPVLDGIAWYGGNSSVRYKGTGWPTSDWKEKQYPGGNAGPREVATKQANPWGLNDMLGNVWEWCRDWYGTYPGGSVTDPTGPASGLFRVDRGGGWGDRARGCRAAVRYSLDPGLRSNFLGFRVALALQASQ